MSHAVHPSQALFAGEKPFPVIPSCEHFAGSEKLIGKALELQEKLGPVFDITCDCEDGAPAGQERAHAEMIVRVLTSAGNKHRMAGARIHDYSHTMWKQDVDILVGGAGKVLAYITIPKCTSFAEAKEMIDYIQQVAANTGAGREIPTHVLVETHGALRDVHRIAALPSIQVLDFGLMDFVSGHHGAIPAAAMRSPGQFEHKLLVRAKTDSLGDSGCGLPTVIAILLKVDSLVGLRQRVRTDGSRSASGWIAGQFAPILTQPVIPVGAFKPFYARGAGQHFGDAIRPQHRE